MDHIFALVIQKLEAMATDIAALKTHMSALTGNGQPGSIAELRERLDEHDRQINRWRGAVAVLGFLLLVLFGHEAWRALTS